MSERGLLVNVRNWKEWSNCLEGTALELVMGVSVLSKHRRVPHLELLLLHHEVLLALRLNWCRHVSSALESGMLRDRLWLSVYDNSFYLDLAGLFLLLDKDGFDLGKGAIIFAHCLLLPLLFFLLLLAVLRFKLL